MTELITCNKGSKLILWKAEKLIPYNSTIPEFFEMWLELILELISTFEKIIPCNSIIPDFFEKLENEFHEKKINYILIP